MRLARHRADASTAALAIRYRLGLEEDEAIPSAAYLELLFNATLVTKNVSNYVRSPIRAVDPREALSRLL